MFENQVHGGDQIILLEDYIIFLCVRGSCLFYKFDN